MNSPMSPMSPHPDFVVIPSGAPKVYPGVFSAAHGCPILTVYAVKPVASQFSLMVARLASLGLRNR